MEIGAGTGINLPHYPVGQKPLLCEPDAQMRKQLQKKLSGPQQQIQVTNWSAERLELPSESVDTVVSTLVLCSVKDQQLALKEIVRVLRPNGQLLFIEHVLSDREKIVRWQTRFEPFWRCACGNCHLTRATASNIAASGMLIEEMLEAEMLGAPAVARRTLRGRARKPETAIHQSQDS